MNTFMTVLAAHTQYYEDSCAASGMEIVLILHALVPPDFRQFQDRYKNRNIGFEELADLQPYKVQASAEELPFAAGLSRISAECRQCRYPLVSAPSGVGKWHIWVAALQGSDVILGSRGYGNPIPLFLRDMDRLHADLCQFRSGKIHIATYTIKNG
jgi:hypothetical protein